jgi:hypothetical protein
MKRVLFAACVMLLLLLSLAVPVGAAGTTIANPPSSGTSTGITKVGSGTLNIHIESFSWGFN